MFPRSYIHFGVLHGMAVMLVVARCTADGAAGCGRPAPWPWRPPWAAGRLLAGPAADWAPWFNSNALNWLGLVSRKPFTEDYVPVLPWLGVMWWGLAAGQWVLRHHPGWLALPLHRRVRPPGGAGALEPELLHAAPAGAHRRLAGRGVDAGPLTGPEGCA